MEVTGDNTVKVTGPIEASCYGVIPELAKLANDRAKLLESLRNNVQRQPSGVDTGYAKEGAPGGYEIPEGIANQMAQAPDNAVGPTKLLRSVRATITGVKADNGKPEIASCFVGYFPRAMAEVARVSEYGLAKYRLRAEDRNFMYVADGFKRYTNGLMRHLAGETTDSNAIDPESQLKHAAMVAWNAMARLEILLDSTKDKQ